MTSSAAAAARVTRAHRGLQSARRARVEETGGEEKNKEPTDGQSVKMRIHKNKAGSGGEGRGLVGVATAKVNGEVRRFESVEAEEVKSGERVSTLTELYERFRH